MSIEQQNLPQTQEAAIDAAKINQIQDFLDNLDDKESRDEFSKLLTSSVMEALKNIPDETKAKLGDSFKKAYDKNKDDPAFQNLMESIYQLWEIFWSNMDALSFDSSKINTLKDLLSGVDVNNKEYWMMLIYMCGKADDFIDSCKENQSNTKDVFENFRTSCINELKDRWYDDVKNIVYD